MPWARSSQLTKTQNISLVSKIFCNLLYEVIFTCVPLVKQWANILSNNSEYYLSQQYCN